MVQPDYKAQRALREVTEVMVQQVLPVQLVMMELQAYKAPQVPME
jgi:hypothetical protein